LHPGDAIAFDQLVQWQINHGQFWERIFVGIEGKKSGRRLPNGAAMRQRLQADFPPRLQIQKINLRLKVSGKALIWE
jgi:hypothetical protein